MAFWVIVGKRVSDCLKLSSNIFLDQNILHKHVGDTLYTLLPASDEKVKVMREADFIPEDRFSMTMEPTRADLSHVGFAKRVPHEVCARC